MPENLIRSDLLLSRLDQLALIGARKDGGVTRLAFSNEDSRGQRWVIDRMREVGLHVRIDALGNVLGLTHEKGQPVVLGSHSDTVGAGGRYDGALGVVAALEVVASLKAEGEQRPIGVVSFVNEEGVRYMPDMMGSLFACGDLDLADLRAVRGTDGIELGKALDESGMAGSDPIDPRTWRAFLELHIEQGPVLEAEGASCGVVTGVQGLRWYRVRFTGRANHAGTTPMQRRSDAMVPAAALVTACRRLTTEIDGLRATVGRLSPEPNLINVMPGAVEMTVDLRHPDPSVLAAAEQRLYDLAGSAAASESVRLEISRIADAPPVQFDRLAVRAVEEAARALGLSARHLVSGAGHDAQIVARACPTAMVFVPSVGGVSHSPDEFSTPEACIDGANVLLGATRRLLGQAGA